MPGGRGHVERAGRAALDAVEGEAGQVPHVDRLDRALRHPGRQDQPTPRDAPKPPGQAADVLVRSQDHACPQHQRPPAKRRLDRPLAPGLVAPVPRSAPARLVPGRTGHVRGAVVDRRGLADAPSRPAGVDRDRGKERVPFAAAGERAGGVADHAGHVAAGVHHRVPRAPRDQAREVGRNLTVPPDGLDARRVPAASSPVEGRDGIPPPQRCFDDHAPDEPRPAKDQQPHDHALPPQPSRCTGSGHPGQPAAWPPG